MNDKTVYASYCILFVGLLFVSCGLAGYIPPMPQKSEPKTCRVITNEKTYDGLVLIFSNGANALLQKQDGKTIRFYGTFVVEDE